MKSKNDRQKILYGDKTLKYSVQLANATAQYPCIYPWISISTASLVSQ